MAASVGPEKLVIFELNDGFMTKRFDFGENSGE
jgi:hypothetical protein